MKNCLLRNLRDAYPICSKCIKNPFKIEKCRQILVDTNDTNALKKMYNSSLPGIKNLNTSTFWDFKLSETQYLRDQDGMTKDRVKTAFRFLPNHANKVLDVGPGQGFLEELLTRKKIKVYGIDISPEAIKNLQDRLEGRFKKESLYKMIYSKIFFDCIFMLEVLEHIPADKTFKVLSRIKDILKRRGFLIISVPMNEGLDRIDNNPSGHTRMYTEDLIKWELEYSGFKVLRTKTLYAFSNFYLFKSLLAKIVKRWSPNNIVVLAQKK